MGTQTSWDIQILIGRATLLIVDQLPVIVFMLVVILYRGKAKKQNVVARSSAEAKYRAMATTACELVWLKGLVEDLGCSCSTLMTLFCDNQAAMHIAVNPVFHERTKHIEVDYHYIRQQVQSKLVRTSYVRSNDQLADVFTKVLTSAQFSRLLGKLGSINPLDPA